MDAVVVDEAKARSGYAQKVVGMGHSAPVASLGQPQTYLVVPNILYDLTEMASLGEV